MIPNGLDLRLRRRQVKPSITTQEVAPLVGISHAVLYAIENGTVTVDRETHDRIAAAIDDLCRRKIEAGLAKRLERAPVNNLIRRER